MRDNLVVIDRESVPVYVTDKGEKVVYGSELHDALECKSNFREWVNRRFTDIDAVENEDYQGVEISTPSGQTKKDYIIKLDTAKEMAMLERNEKGKAVRKHFIEIEKRYQEENGLGDISLLDPKTQLLLMMTKTMAKHEIEQKRIAAEQSRIAEHVDYIETKIENIRDIFTEEIGDWKAEINHKVREISQRSNIAYQELWNKLYADLEIRANCSLSRLAENKVKRMEKAGNTKTTIKEATTKLAVIFDNKRIREIFTTIVKEYAIKYCA